MTRAMFDSVTAARLPTDALMVACYTDGRYANEPAVRARCPHALVVRVTPHGLAGAHVADCETGDLTPPQAAAWAKAEVKAGRKPTIYCSLSIWDTVKHQVAMLGLTGQVSWWIAHYNNDPTIPDGAVAVQYRNDVAGNLDYSAVRDYWPGVDPESKPQSHIDPTPIPSPTPVQEDTLTHDEHVALIETRKIAGVTDARVDALTAKLDVLTVAVQKLADAQAAK